MWKKLKISEPNKILRIAIINPQYQLTTDSIHYIFSQYGNVVRIVIFQKTGMNAMVEYESVEGNFKIAQNAQLIKFSIILAATFARKALCGFDMFWGCNTLQIEFAWTEKLIVTVNDVNRSWDFTKDAAMMQSHDSGFPSTSSQNNSQNYGQLTAADYTNTNMMTMHNDLQSVTISFAICPQYQPNIMMVSGLNHELSNTDKLFNLLSLYGNVSRIQFLPNYQGTAVVQMFDQMSVEYCINYLNNCPIGVHGQLQVYWIQQTYQPNEFNAFILPDGSRSFKDYTESRNQRFMIPRPAYWIQAPSKIVRFYNTPPHLTKENLILIFNLKNVPPKDANLLRAYKDTRTSRGLLEFPSIAQAVRAIMVCNNTEIKSNAKGFHYMKLCFSSSQTLELK